MSTAEARSRSIPWYGYAVVLGGTSIVVGVLWDISWHSTVGRDTFWTAAHMAIYVGGVLGGASCGWLAWKTTFRGSARQRAASVRVWGARAPLGAWVSIWGAVAMLTSAPFDDWWHNAYGLDVEILSPPHTVLAAGMFGIALGAMLLVTGWQNRQEGEGRRSGAFLCACAAGILLTMAATYITDFSYPNRQHSGIFYRASCATYPLYLVAAARAVRLPLPATATAAVYTAVQLLMGWILPLFPAEPLLAPIHNRVDHMVPPPFPLLLILPALAIDLTLRWLRPGSWTRDLVLSVALGTVFLAVFLPVQWFFSEFLLSPAADNHLFFGARFFAYFNRPGEWMHSYWGTRSDPVTAAQIVAALVLAVVSAGIGLRCGGWMSRVKR